MTIEAFTGLPGQGKTYNMVKKAYKQHNKGRKVYANFDCNFAEYFKELSDITHVRDALILLDEAGIYLPAQAWNKIPFNFMRQIRQHRKGGLDLWYTAQDMSDVATALRRVTQFQHDFNKYGSIMCCRTINPKTKGRYGFDISILDKKVFSLYDTNDEVDFGEFLKGNA